MTEQTKKQNPTAQRSRRLYGKSVNCVFFFSSRPFINEAYYIVFTKTGFFKVDFSLIECLVFKQYLITAKMLENTYYSLSMAMLIPIKTLY